MSFDEEVQVATVESEEPVEIDEERIDRSLDMLQNADPTGEVDDPPEMGMLEGMCVVQKWVSVYIRVRTNLENSALA